MKIIKITKEQLNKLISMNNPLVISESDIDEGDRIICDDTNEVYLVSEKNKIDTIRYSMFAYIKIKGDYVDLYDWESNKLLTFPFLIHFTTISKLEKIIQSKEVNLNLLEHK